MLEGRPAALLEAPALARVLGATRFGTVWIFRHGLLLAAFLVVRLPVRRLQNVLGLRSLALGQVHVNKVRGVTELLGNISRH